MNTEVRHGPEWSVNETMARSGHTLEYDTLEHACDAVESKLFLPTILVGTDPRCKPVRQAIMNIFHESLTVDNWERIAADIVDRCNEKRLAFRDIADANLIELLTTLSAARETATYEGRHSESKPNLPASPVKDDPEIAIGPQNQKIVDEIINKYRETHFRLYKDALDNMPNALVKAQKEFGRNYIARHADPKIRSKALISSSQVWIGIADALDIPRGQKKGRKKVGLAIAEESKAISNGNITANEVEKRDVIRAIQKDGQLDPTAKSAWIEQIENGKMTADRAHELLEELKKDHDL